MLTLRLLCSLQNKIAQNRFWPVEIMRTPVQQVTKAKGKQASLEEDIPISYHGVAYVNMAPLLYPGVKRFVTADRLHTSLRASSPIWASEASHVRMRERGAGFAARLRVLVRLISLAQIGELARRLLAYKIIAHV